MNLSKIRARDHFLAQPLLAAVESCEKVRKQPGRRCVGARDVRRVAAKLGAGVNQKERKHAGGRRSRC